MIVKGMVQTRLECSECGTQVFIMRKRGKQKKRGHIKHMYCIGCKETTGFIELKNEDKNIAYWNNLWESVDEEEMEDNV